MEIKELKSLIRYDRKTGKFYWKPRGVQSFDGRFAGKEAGYSHISGRGRVSWAIKVNGRKYYAHILAWAYMTNRWPSNEIDHINHDTFDNRYRNLREVTNSENKKNLPRKSNNTSGYTGVVKCSKTGKWVSTITVEKKTIYLGSFKLKSKAVEARRQANTVYGFHRNHGK